MGLLGRDGGSCNAMYTSIFMLFAILFLNSGVQTE